MVKHWRKREVVQVNNKFNEIFKILLYYLRGGHMLPKGCALNSLMFDVALRT